MLQGIYIIVLLGVGLWSLWGNGYIESFFPQSSILGNKEGFVVQRSAKYQYGLSCKDYENYWRRPKKFCGYDIYAPYIPDTLCDRTLRKLSYKGCQ